MSPSIDVLASEWELVRRALPDVSDAELAQRVVDRGRIVVAEPIEDRVPDHLPPGERRARLRRTVARRAASVAVHRFELVTGRERFDRAEQEEQDTYERHLELHKDIVPPLKLKAKALRAEVRRLEHEAWRLGIDVDAVQPAIGWPDTIAVDDYQPPHYETNESRKRAAVEFFRRVRKG